MELTTVVKAEVRVSAQLADDGKLSVKTFATAEYAPGCTTTIDIPQEKVPEALLAKLRDALEAVMDHAKPKLGGELNRAIAKSYEVAAAHGEV